MAQFETKSGSKLVRSASNGSGSPWSSRLYVNGGDTATLTAAKHKSEAGARAWADKVLAQ